MKSKRVYPALEEFENSNEITQTLESLNNECKEPFNLFVQGYKCAEIANTLNIPVEIVKHRIFLTRKKLANILNEYL